MPSDLHGKVAAAAAGTTINDFINKSLSKELSQHPSAI